ncbi:AAA family ATPase [Glaciecola sp.]|jgi:chromosome partitioning protein|uniref:AAA family ATPase n=1 Tax=Glaciecola sp. MF2-115 TaxID=3384827 RepID=UPI0039891B9F|mmetsp:Transcript_53823/g.170937  ORF Transcript_53823/g.170937 Transcript_53823/m.170937 type:complete len:227 (+) Transcript_53823:70-750(+)
MIILVGGEKGGSGKSCIAQNLATYLAVDKVASVLLVDCDIQGTTADWIKLRNNNFNALPIDCVQLNGKIRNQLLGYNSQYQYVIVDCGAQDLLALRSTLSAADVALLPMRPKRRDLKTLVHLDELVNSCKMVNQQLAAHIVFTQCPSQPNQQTRVNDAKQTASLFDIPIADAVLHERHIYDDSEESGLSVLESEPKGKAADELRSLFALVLNNEMENSPEIRMQYA